jgi:hypothetical protein
MQSREQCFDRAEGLHSAVIRDRTRLHQNRLSNGVTLILEIKGFEDDETKAKHNAAKRWVSAANNWGQLGKWDFHVCGTQVLEKEIDYLVRKS